MRSEAKVGAQENREAAVREREMRVRVCALKWTRKQKSEKESREEGGEEEFV